MASKVSFDIDLTGGETLRVAVSEVDTVLRVTDIGGVSNIVMYMDKYEVQQLCGALMMASAVAERQRGDK